MISFKILYIVCMYLTYYLIYNATDKIYKYFLFLLEILIKEISFQH